MPNKLTDTEIKKALEYCIEATDCIDCNVNQECDGRTVLRYALDLINRKEFRIHQQEKTIMEIQNANLIDFKATIGNYISEIESLKAEVERLQNTLDDVLDREPLLVERSEKYAKAEAYKECIEAVKEKSCKINMCHNDIVVKTDYQISGESLDNLLNELVGE